MTVQLGSAYGEIVIGTEGAERATANLASSMREIGTKMSLAVTAPLVGIATMALKSAGDFEQSMNVMQQVTGATAEQMAQMQAQALQLGRDTTFSAGEAADGMLEMAKAGMSTEEVMAAIPGVMSLAAAGNMELAQAAEVTANAVNAFGLPAEDAVRVADLLAAAANSSSVEVTDMAQAFQMSAAVFAGNKIPIEDLSTAIAILGDNGLKGSDAGTSLKTMMMKLTAPTKEAAAEMSKYGIEIYDANGAMLPFQQILEQLSATFAEGATASLAVGGATDDQAKAYERATEKIGPLTSDIALQQQQLGILNQEMAVTTAQYGAGSIQAQKKQLAIDKLTTAIAENQAKLVGLQGDIEGFSQAQASAGRVTADVTDAMRNEALTTIFGSDAIRAANILIREGTVGFTEMKVAVTEQGAAGEVADARMKGLTGAIEYLKGSVDSFLIETALPFLDSLGGIIRQVADAITWFGQLPAPVKNAALAFAAVLAVVGPLMLAIGLLVPVLGAILSPIGLVIGAVAGLAAAWATDFGGIREAVGSVMAVFDPFVEAVRQFGGAALDEIMTFVNGGETQFTALKAILAAGWDAVKDAFNGIVTSVAEALPRWASALARWGERMWSWIVEAGPQTMRALATWTSDLFGGLVAALPDFLRMLRDWTVAAAVWVLDSIGDLLRNMASYVNRLSDWLSGPGTGEIEHGLSYWVAAMWEWVRDELWPKLGPALGSLMDGVLTIMMASGRLLVTAMLTLGKDLVLGIWDGIKAVWGSFTSFWQGIWTGTVNWVKDLLGIASPSKVFEEFGRNIVLGMGQGIEAEGQGAVDALGGYVAAMTARAQAGVEQVRNALGGAGTYVGREASEGLAWGLNPGLGEDVRDIRYEDGSVRTVAEQVKASLTGFGQNLQHLGPQFAQNTIDSLQRAMGSFSEFTRAHMQSAVIPTLERLRSAFENSSGQEGMEGFLEKMRMLYGQLVDVRNDVNIYAHGLLPRQQLSGSGATFNINLGTAQDAGVGQSVINAVTFLQSLYV